MRDWDVLGKVERQVETLVKIDHNNNPTPGTNFLYLFPLPLWPTSGKKDLLELTVSWWTWYGNHALLTVSGDGGLKHSLLR